MVRRDLASSLFWAGVGAVFCVGGLPYGFGSMYIGNAMLVALNMPLIGLWVRILKIPYYFLAPLILMVCLIGAYSLNNSIVDLVIMVIFGILGYLMNKFDYPSAPLILAMVLGPMFEESLRQSLILSGGSPLIFVSHPISAVLVVISLALLVSPVIFRKRGQLRGGDAL